MKHLRIFSTDEELQNELTNLTTPTISYIENIAKSKYQNYILAIYDVEDITVPTRLLGEEFSDTSIIHQIVIDDGTIIDNYANHRVYTFTTTGKHKVRYILKQELTNIPSYMFYKCIDMCYIEIPKTINEINDYAFSGYRVTNEDNTKTTHSGKLTYFDFSNITRIGKQSFAYQSFKELNLKDITFYATQAFVGNDLEKVIAINCKFYITGGYGYVFAPWGGHYKMKSYYTYRCESNYENEGIGWDRDSDCVCLIGDDSSFQGIGVDDVPSNPSPVKRIIFGKNVNFNTAYLLGAVNPKEGVYAWNNLKELIFTDPIPPISFNRMWAHPSCPPNGIMYDPIGSRNDYENWVKKLYGQIKTWRVVEDGNKTNIDTTPPF